MSGRQDLNLRPPAPKAGALPNCATSRFSFLLNLQNLVGPSVSEEKLYITLRKKENRQLKWTFEGFQTGQECALYRKSMNNRSIALISLSFRSHFANSNSRTRKPQDAKITRNCRPAVFAFLSSRRREFGHHTQKQKTGASSKKLEAPAIGGNDGNRTRVFSLEG